MKEETGQVNNFNARKDRVLSGGYGVSEKALKLLNKPAPLLHALEDTRIVPIMFSIISIS